MSSVFRKLIPPFFKHVEDPNDLFLNDELDPIEDEEPYSSSSSSSDIPESLQDSIETHYEVPFKRSIDRPINPRKLPDGFVEALSDILTDEDDPYTKLILYSHVICGTRIDILRERFVVSSPRGKQYIASREFVRHRLNKSLERLKERYYEINGGIGYVSTIDDSEEPYHAEVSSAHSYTYHDTMEKTGSPITPSTKGVPTYNESEEEQEHDVQKADVQEPSSSKEKHRTKYPRKKLLFVIDEEDYEETDLDGISISAHKDQDL